MATILRIAKVYKNNPYTKLPITYLKIFNAIFNTIHPFETVSDYKKEQLCAEYKNWVTDIIRKYILLKISRLLL